MIIEKKCGKNMNTIYLVSRDGVQSIEQTN